MTPADQLTPAAVAAVGFEVALGLCGLFLIWRLVLSRRAREAGVAALPPWDLPPIDFACYAFCAVLGYLALGGMTTVVLRYVHPGEDATKVLGGAVQDLGLLLGILGFHLFYRARAAGAAIPPLARGVFRSGVATFLIVMPLVVAANLSWAFVLTKLGFPMENQDLVDVLENTNSPWVKASLMAIAILLAPVTEEVIFRGGLFRYFRTRVPRWMAIGLTSALFGSLHVSWDSHLVGLPSLAPLIVLAAVFCVAYERTGTIGTVIVAHALFNLNTFVLVAAGIRS